MARSEEHARLSWNTARLEREIDTRSKDKPTKKDDLKTTSTEGSKLPRQKPGAVRRARWTRKDERP